MAKKTQITEPGTYEIEVYTKEECEEFKKATGLSTQSTYPITVHKFNGGWHAYWQADICTKKPHKTAMSAIGTVKRLIIKAGV